MTDMQEKITAVMLKALSKTAVKYGCSLTGVRCRMYVDRSGELNIFLSVLGTLMKTVTLTELIGMMYGMAARPKLKQILFDLEKQYDAARGGIVIEITSPDKKSVQVAIYKGEQLQKTVDISELVK